jgi:hypothetical protein
MTGPEIDRWLKQRELDERHRLWLVNRTAALNRLSTQPDPFRCPRTARLV